jgi:hypothetical protein
LFLKELPKLKEFKMDNTEIKVVECEEWVLRVEVELGIIKELAKLLKEDREKHVTTNANN